MCYASNNSGYRKLLIDEMLKQYSPPVNALMDPYWLPKSQYVSGHFKHVPNALYGSEFEYIPAYWRRRVL